MQGCTPRRGVWRGFADFFKLSHGNADFSLPEDFFHHYEVRKNYILEGLLKSSRSIKIPSNENTSGCSQKSENPKCTNSQRRVCQKELSRKLSHTGNKIIRRLFPRRLSTQSLIGGCTLPFRKQPSQIDFPEHQSSPPKIQARNLSV